MKKYFFSALSFLGLSFIFAPKALAVCPICTIAVASGLGFSRYLGIDDAISGLWIGGLTVSMIAWTINFCDKKKFNFKGRDLSIIFLFFILMMIPFHFSNLVIGSWNIFSPEADKLLLGFLSGSAAFWAGTELSDLLKKKNGGKVYFPFQKVILPITPLIILSLIMYFI